MECLDHIKEIRCNVIEVLFLNRISSSNLDQNEFSDAFSDKFKEMRDYLKKEKSIAIIVINKKVESQQEVAGNRQDLLFN